MFLKRSRLLESIKRAVL